MKYLLLSTFSGAASACLKTQQLEHPDKTFEIHYPRTAYKGDYPESLSGFDSVFGETYGLTGKNLPPVVITIVVCIVFVGSAIVYYNRQPSSNSSEESNVKCLGDEEGMYEPC